MSLMVYIFSILNMFQVSTCSVLKAESAILTRTKFIIYSQVVNYMTGKSCNQKFKMPQYKDYNRYDLKIFKIMSS